MSILFHKTPIPDLFLITAHQVNDERGYLTKYYDKDIYKENGLTPCFCETAEIMSRKGVLRGLHYQINPSQARLIHVASGLIFNVSLDLRKTSATFGKYECCYISKDKAVFVPEEFANGFLAMEDSIVVCHYSSKFISENCDGIIWNDTELGIPWPLQELNETLYISEKDKKLQLFSQYKRNRL